MENEKLKYIIAKQKIAEKNPEFQNKNIYLKIKYSDFGLAYGMQIEQEFSDMLFLAKRIEEYRSGEKVKAISLEKDFIKVWLIKNG
jgi:hypothetical protein